MFLIPVPCSIPPSASEGTTLADNRRSSHLEGPHSLGTMGRWQPYLYDSQRTDSDDFNPKAVTMASHQPPSPRKSREGPLVNFNKHPDSYVVLPYGNNKTKGMNPNVKIWVKVTRGTQLILRVLTLLGAIGVLLCTVFLRGVQTAEGYIMRIPPGVDLVNCLYAVYHLLRAAHARPAGSSASYHFFALVMDGGFIPLYVFTALYSKRNSDLEAGTKGRWRTIFPTDEEADKVLLTAWLTATTVAGLHIVSLVLDLHLLVVFRKISHLPPDMNPLEENLTTRRKNKHKHKNSSISALEPLTGQDKRFSTQSEAATLIGSRKSQADPYHAEKNVPSPDENHMSFLHTRRDSNTAYSPHTPQSARHSRIYSQPPSAAASRGDLHRRGDDSDNETLSQRKAILAQQKRNSQAASTMSSKQSFYTPPSTADNDQTSGDLSKQKLQSDNWFVLNGPADDADQTSALMPKSPAQQNKSGVRSIFSSAQGYKVVSPYDNMSDDENDAPLMPQPLRMNPITPPPIPDTEANATPQLKRTHTITTLSSEKTFNRSASRSTPGKSRYYGDLKAATEGIRRGSPSNAASKPTTPTANAKTSPILAPVGLEKKSFNSVRRTGETGHLPVQAQSPRVVSRSGVDYIGRFDFDFDDDANAGTPGRRREVSGKVAEEGRGGPSYGGPRGGELTYRKVSEVGA